MSAFNVLADPVRLRIVRHLSEHGEATLPELADVLGVALNTARPHVQALEEAHVVERRDRPSGGPGRPALVYRLVADWVVATTDFLGLAQLLATVVLRCRPDLETVGAAGHDWGRWWLGRPGGHRSVEAELPRALERLGFDAEVDERGVVLSACPCPLVAPDDPLVMCELSAGTVEGILAGSATGVRVGSRHHDPPRRRCRIELRHPPPSHAGSSANG